MDRFVTIRYCFICKSKLLENQLTPKLLIFASAKLVTEKHNCFPVFKACVCIKWVKITHKMWQGNFAVEFNALLTHFTVRMIFIFHTLKAKMRYSALSLVTHLSMSWPVSHQLPRSETSIHNAHKLLSITIELKLSMAEDVHEARMIF